jgi:hypothetical protein
MPRGDGTGPSGLGPMTGRRVGFCAGFRVPGYLNFVGRGSGLGCGRGYRRMLWVAALIPCCASLAYRWGNRNRIQERSRNN